MPNVKIKAVKFDAIKTDGDTGTITGYASTWTREPDSYGDVVAQGAFAESIEQIKSEGRVLPLLWNHSSDDLSAYIGTVTELSEDDHGLLFTATFDATPEAQRVRELARDGRISKLSFAYEILDAEEIELEDGRSAYELRKLNIHEVSLVMYPANDDTAVTEVKAAVDALAKSGRRNSKSDEETIRQAISLLESLLTDEQDDADETEDEPAKGGEGMAMPEGREVDDSVRLEAYKEALLSAYATKS